MKYISRGVNLDEEVWRELSKLRDVYGSYNKGLRAVLITQNCGILDKKDVYGGFPGRGTSLDAVGPEIASGKGKISTETS